MPMVFEEYNSKFESLISNTYSFFGERNSISDIELAGEMTERPKVYAWKAYVPEKVPRVRIPISP